MATAGINHMVLWTDLEGQEVGGRWTLRRLVRPEGRTAWFEATDADGKAVMLSVTETLNDEDELLERLRATAEVRHPNVVGISDAQVATVEETPVVVAAMEPTEENLGDVLRDRALTVGEARQVLEALLAGLTAIHARGLVHGRMEAASVLATGETIKLRSDCIHLGRSGGAGTQDAAGEDVRGAGRIVTQAVTRRLPSGENDAVLQLLPDPMARAIRRALSGNATAAEIAALAGTRLEVMPAPAPVKAPTAPAAVAETKPVAPAAGRAEPAAVAVEAPRAEPVKTAAPRPAAAVPAPAAAPEADKIAPRVIPMKAAEVRVEATAVQEPVMATRTARNPEDEEPEPGRRRSAPWVIGAAAVVVLATIFVLYGMLHRGPAKTANSTAPAATAPAVVPAPAPKPAAEAVSPNAAAMSAGAGLMAAPGAGWRVVVYTYNHQGQAQQKAEALAKRYPDLHPDVFTPKSGAPYLVTLGAAMSRADANALRERAVRMGLPRDTYAENFR